MGALYPARARGPGCRAAGYSSRGPHRRHDPGPAYVKNGVLRPVVIPTYDEIPVALIRNNLKTAGLGRDEYFELLGRT